MTWAESLFSWKEIILAGAAFLNLAWRVFAVRHESSKSSRELLDMAERLEAHEGPEADLLRARHYEVLRRWYFRSRSWKSLGAVSVWTLAGLAIMQTGSENASVRLPFLVLGLACLAAAGGSYRKWQGYVETGQYQVHQILERKTSDAYERYAASNPMENLTPEENRFDAWFDRVGTRLAKVGWLRKARMPTLVLLGAAAAILFVASYFYGWNLRL